MIEIEIREIVITIVIAQLINLILDTELDGSNLQINH